MKFEHKINTLCLISVFYLTQSTQSTLAIFNKLSTIKSPAISQDVHVHKALVGSRTRLNCKFSVVHNDSVTLILWYRKRDATGPPFYTIDARERSLQSAEHVISNANYTGRVEFDLNRSQLVISSIQEADEGDYTCRVDFKASRTRYTLNRLLIQVPPKNLIIEDVNSGKLLSRKVGPYNENSTLTLSCRAFAGQPKPYLEWYIDDVPVKISDSRYDPMKDETYTRLEVKLERKYDKSQIKCVANLKDFPSVLVTEITVQLNLTPLNTTIQFIKSNVVAGNIEMISCHSHGSKPPANLTWFIENDANEYSQLNNSRLTIDEINLMTTSLLRFTPSAKDNGKHLICKAINSAFPDYYKQDSILLNVYHTPNVHLSISGPERDKNTFMEGNSVRMICNTSFSNPEVTYYSWYHENSRIGSAASIGISVTDETLVIHSVKKEHIGRYYCIVNNNIGESKSNSVNLNIFYAPQCKGQKMLYAFRPHIPIRITCQVDANPPEVTFSWTESAIPSDIEYNITSNGLISYLTFTSSTTNETIFSCSASNSVGKSKDSCSFTVKPAAPPDPPKDCNISQTNLLTCVPGSDGGVDQNFVVRIHPSDNLDELIGEKIANADPVFPLKGLQANRSYQIEIYAENGLGHSASLIISFTARTSEASLLSIADSNEINLISMIVYPSLVILTIIILLTFFIVRIYSKSASYKPPEDGTSPIERYDNPDLTNFPEDKIRKEDSIDSNIEKNKFLNGTNLLVGVDSGGNVVTREIGDNVVVAIRDAKTNKITLRGVNDEDEDTTLIPSTTYLVTDKNARNMEVSTQVAYSTSANKLSSMVQDTPSPFSTPV